MNEIDKFDIFEDRAQSLINRWKTFKEKHKDTKNIDEICISGFLSEINDNFTVSLLEGRLQNN